MTTSAARRTLNSADSRENSLTEECVRFSDDKRGHIERDEDAQVSQWILRKPLCQRMQMTQYVHSERKE